MKKSGAGKMQDEDANQLRRHSYASTNILVKGAKL